MTQDPSRPERGANLEKPEGVDFAQFCAELRRFTSILQSVEVMPKEFKCSDPNYRLIPRGGIDLVRDTWPEKALEGTPI